MEVILISKASRVRSPLRLGSLGVFFVLLAALAAAVAVGYGTFKLGQGFPVVGAPVLVQPPTSELVDAALRGQKREIQEAILLAENNMDALALRLGELQAHIIRLNALGSRLVELADIGPEEFDFTDPPARGGPEVPSSIEAQSVPDFLRALDELAAELDDRAPKLEVLEALLLDSKLDDKFRPTGRPVDKGWMSSGFGWRSDPMTGKRTFHYGIDFASSAGSEVVAVAPGVIVESGYRKGSGNVVRIKHGNGYETVYAHNKKNLAAVGDTVEKGQRVALVGSTGRSTGSHVHFEVRQNGKSVNPWKYVRASN